MPNRNKKGGQIASGRRSGGTGLIGKLVGGPRTNTKFDPNKPVSEENPLMQPASGLRRFLGDNADDINANAMMQERANNMDIARATATEQLRQQNALALENIRANNELQRLGVGANIDLAKANSLARMQQEYAIAAENEKLQRLATARLLKSGGLSSETPLAPESFAEIGARERADMPLRELGRQEAEKDATQNVEREGKQATAAYQLAHAQYLQDELKRPRMIGQNILERDGKLFSVDPSSTIKTPAGYDFKTGKPTPETVTRIPGGLSPLDLENDPVAMILGNNTRNESGTANNSNGSVFPDNAAPSYPSGANYPARPTAASQLLKPNTPAVSAKPAQQQAIDLMEPRSWVVPQLRKVGLPTAGTEAGNQAIFYGDDAAQKYLEGRPNDAEAMKSLATQKLFRSLYDPNYRKQLAAQQAYYEY